MHRVRNSPSFIWYVKRIPICGRSMTLSNVTYQLETKPVSSATQHCFWVLGLDLFSMHIICVLSSSNQLYFCAEQVNQQNAVFVDSLNTRKDSLLQELTDIQNQLLRLQEILQEKVAGTRVRYKDAVSPAPNFLDFITRRDSTKPIVQITDNELPSEERTPFDQQAEISCTTSVAGRGFCRPLVRCALFYADIPEIRKQPCVLREGVFGVCCPQRIAQSKYRGEIIII